MNDTPNTKVEKDLEVLILQHCIIVLQSGGSTKEILNVLERVRHLVTEINIECEGLV